MRILRARLLAAAQEAADAEASDARRRQVRTVDRSERIRTYNFPENRITDHRVGFKAYNLDQVLDGDLDAVVQALRRRRPRRAARRRMTAVTACRATSTCGGSCATRPPGWPRPASSRRGTTPRMLAAHALGVEPRELVLPRPCTTDQAEAVRGAASTGALRRDPAAAHHRAGVFRHLTLAVGPGVFVPRPETEVVVEAAIDAVAAGRRRASAPRWSSTCAPAPAPSRSPSPPRSRGAGARRRARPRTRTTGPRATSPGLGVDLQPRRCRRRRFHELDGTVDVVVSNPPYIPDGAVIRDPEVLAHDPALALWGGATTGSTSCAASSAARGRGCCGPAAVLVVEHADLPGRGGRRAAARRTGAFADVTDHQDLAGRDRFTTGRRDARGSHVVSRFFDCAVAAERDARARRRLARRSAAASSSCSPPTRSTASAATRSPSAGVDALLAAKGRGRDMPVPVLVGSPRTLDGLAADLPQQARDLVEAFWPGALTVVCRQAPSLPWDLGDTGGTVAVRMPLHPVAIELLREPGRWRLSRRTTPASRLPPPLDEAVGAARRRGRRLPRRRPVRLGRSRRRIVDVTGPVPCSCAPASLDADTIRRGRAGARGPDDRRPAFLVLHVCTGNICRSPMAELLMRAGWTSGTAPKPHGSSSTGPAPIRAMLGTRSTHLPARSSVISGSMRPHSARRLSAAPRCPRRPGPLRDARAHPTGRRPGPRSGGADLHPAAACRGGGRRRRRRARARERPRAAARGAARPGPAPPRTARRRAGRRGPLRAAAGRLPGHGVADPQRGALHRRYATCCGLGSARRRVPKESVMSDVPY